MTHVVSCRFLRLGCNEETHPLFRREYARSNRERGVKLLRCFPHCCPRHVKRSYCGCSVHVLVTFSTDVRAMTLDDILVYARFEPSRVAPLWPESLAGLARDLGAPGAENVDSGQEKCWLDIGENVSLPVSVYSGQAANQGDGAREIWIRAERESDASHRAFPTNTILYGLKNTRSPKWFYSYDSSVTRTQREMTHHLVVYVFRLQRGSDQVYNHVGDDNDMDRSATVLARHASPAFLLVSYRRSRAGDYPGNAQSVMDRPMDIVQGSSPELFAPITPWMAQEQQRPWQDREQRPIGKLPADIFPVTQETYSQHTGYREKRKFVGTASMSGEDSSLWQLDADVRYPGFREKGQHLLILWWFLQRVSVKDTGVIRRLNSTHGRLCWQHAASVLRNPQSNSSPQLEDIMKSFWNETVGDNTPCAVSRHESVETSPPQEPAITQMTACLLLRALYSCTVQRLIHCALQPDSNATRLRERFALLISCVYEFLNGVVCEASSTGMMQQGRNNASLPGIVDNVLSLVYSQRRFDNLRRHISALLMGRQTPGSLSDALNSAFRLFRTQALHHSDETKQRQSIRVDSANKNPLQSAWNRRWLLEPGSVEFIDGTPGSDQNIFASLCIVDVAQVIREFGCIDVEIEEDMSYLAVRSAVSIVGEASGAVVMELVLDGRVRPFSLLPSGLLAVVGVAGRWSISDYAAVFSDDGRSLDIDVFAFSTKSTQAPIRDDVEETKDRGEEDRANNDPGVITLRRVRQTLSLEQQLSTEGLSCGVDPRNLFLLVHGQISGVTYLSPRQHAAGWELGEELGDNFSKLPIEDRAAMYESLQWTPLMEVQAGYVAIPRSSL